MLLSVKWKMENKNVHTPSLYLWETNEETYARGDTNVSIIAVFGQPGILTLSSFQYFLFNLSLFADSFKKIRVVKAVILITFYIKEEEIIEY